MNLLADPVSPARVVRCYFEEVLQHRLAAMRVEWPAESPVGEQHAWKRSAPTCNTCWNSRSCRPRNILAPKSPKGQSVSFVADTVADTIPEDPVAAAPAPEVEAAPADAQDDLPVTIIERRSGWQI